MATSPNQLRGLRLEATCRLDSKSRLTLPEPLPEVVARWNGACTVIKERPGALSLWPTTREPDGVDGLIEAAMKKMEVRSSQNLLEDLMVLGRLRSTRETTAKIDGRARFTIPQTFREFLGVEPEGNAIVVAATVCIEMWRPQAWIEFVEQKIGEYLRLSETILD